MILVVQDSVMPQISELMGFDLHGDLKTVYRALENGGALEVLRDERMMLATGEIKTEGRGRPEIERDIKQKENAVAFLAKRYANEKMDVEALRACILSIADNHTYLMQNRQCCDDMLTFLTQSYSASEPRSAAHSLAILGGRAGARLTHSHANQFSYVLQSLTLWREILHGSRGACCCGCNARAELHCCAVVRSRSLYPCLFLPSFLSVLLFCQTCSVSGACARKISSIAIMYTD